MGFAKRGGFRGGRGRGGSFKNFGGSNFEPCKIRDIFLKPEESYDEQEPRPTDENPRGSLHNKPNHVNSCKAFNEEGEENNDYNSNKKPVKSKKGGKQFNGNGFNDNNYNNDVESFDNGNSYNDQEVTNLSNGNDKYESTKTEKSFQLEDCPFPKLNEDASKYFGRVLEQLKLPFESKEDEEIFLNNVLEETIGQESFLSTTKLGSRCLQSIFLKCKKSSLIRRFLEGFTNDLYVICVDLGATHVTQSLLVCCLNLIQNKEEFNVSDEDGLVFEEWVIKIAEYCIENLQDFIFHEANSTYVIRTLLSVLSGKSVNSTITRRVLKKNTKNPKHLHSCDVDFNYTNMPSSFIKLFKKLAKELTNKEKLIDIITTETSGPIIQVLLLVSTGNYEKLCQKLVKKIAKKTFVRTENESISRIFCHEIGSYCIQRIYEVANAERRNWLWENYVQEQFDQLCLDPRGNYIVREMLKACDNKEEFEKLFERMEPLFDQITKSGYSGLISKLSEMCHKLDTCQAKIIQLLMVTFQCDTPVERQSELATLLLNFESFDSYHSREIPSLEVTLPGSLIMQNALKYHKPHRIVKSLSSMSDEDLVKLACNVSGSFTYDALFKSPFVGEKKRDQVVNRLLPYLSTLACDQSGSRCIDAIWSVSSIKMKSLIAEELLKNDQVLQNDRFGRHVKRNLALHNFKHRKEEWKQLQNVTTKKRKMFDDIIGDIESKGAKIKKEVE